MGETLLNWAVVLASFAVLVLIAWTSYQDLRAFGERRPSPAAGRGPSPAQWHGPAGPPDDVEEPPAEAKHLLRVDYSRNGGSQQTQYITEERPGFIGTESMPGMGPGVLVRHVRLFYDRDGFVIENRHGAQALAWRSDNGRSGEIDSGEALPVDGEIDVLLGGWTVTCREEY